MCVQILICADKIIRKGEVTWLMSYFARSRTFLQKRWSVMDGHNAFPEERGVVEKHFSNGRTTKETDSDWQLGEQ